jgi:Protein of unknown function (DUF2442)
LIERGFRLSVLAETVRFDADRMWVGLSDGRAIAMPLAWFPRLLRASPTEREAFEISPFGLHWAGVGRGHLGRGPAGWARRLRADWG